MRLPILILPHLTRYIIAMFCTPTARPAVARDCINPGTMVDVAKLSSLGKMAP